MSVQRFGTVEVDTDRSRLDLDLTCDFVAGSYWGAGRGRDEIVRSFRHSLCFGLYEEGRQRAFARVVTDRVTFAYLADVFVVEDARGRGLAKILIGSIVQAPELVGVKHWTLFTRDAQRLYAGFGFGPLDDPEGRFMYRRGLTS